MFILFRCPEAYESYSGLRLLPGEGLVCLGDGGCETSFWVISVGLLICSHLIWRIGGFDS